MLILIILALSPSLFQELHQLFADMQLMVEAQGEMLDQIEKQMSRVVATTDESVTALIDANKHQKSARKKMKKIVAVVAVLLIVVIVCGITFGRH